MIHEKRFIKTESLLNLLWLEETEVHCIFVKHNSFHQSIWSPTSDLNTTHIILFKTPRDLHPIDHFARQLKKVEFLRDC